MIQKVLLVCGIISVALYIGTDVLAVILWKEYSPASQTVSELIAINAPTRPIVAPLFVVYALFVFLFGYGVWRSAGQKRRLRFTGGLMTGKEILGVVVTLFFPIHLRGIEGTFSDVMHGILTAVGILGCMFPAMIFGAMAFGKRFRLYSIVTMLVFLICGVLAGLQQPRYVANLPTPWMGVLERINIYGYMLWVVVLAIMLLREEERVHSSKEYLTVVAY